MTEFAPRTLTAGERESGALCGGCGREVVRGEAVAICRDCGAVHHTPCWDATQGCATYECSHAATTNAASTEAPLTISREELAAAVPLPSYSSAAQNTNDPTAEPGRNRRRWNRTAVAAFVVALLGIPLFGLITGLVAIVISCVALAGHTHGRRGLMLAVLAIVIGLFDVVGWAIGLATFLGGQQSMVALDELTLDPESLSELPARISRAMRANVIVETAAGLGRRALGSGVVLKIDGAIAHIVTNRHTVDMNYAGTGRAAPPDLNAMAPVQILTVGQKPLSATVVWIAPHGIDLAIVAVPIDSGEVQEAFWDLDAPIQIGDEVFAVGNPHGLGWTHSAGDVSQIRRRTQDDYSFRVLQTTAAINPGNSGGGLYDAEGRLIGINTLTGDKRFAEGLGFSIDLATLLDLVPESFRLLRKNPPTDEP